ncbi:hypothetical protein [Cellulomonas xiejunii]|uniref:Uncharacterized protein n=1 Tax=Cellulomonas xiejunii TaxID=2968083 RepID=A0ABY5KPI6_9CELL|nr:hypothetical protein [Cellulomonas xiejunii]MCC2320791.1 hypothetical protein [Cellulomonas xiejunii]UUI71077.1 hypothetical protein NP048_14945 [Cellulomonas xiejunii]
MAERSARDLVALLTRRALVDCRRLAGSVSGDLYVEDERLDPRVASDVQPLARIHLLTEIVQGFPRVLRMTPARGERAALDALRRSWAATTASGRRWITARAATEGPRHLATLRAIVGPGEPDVEGLVDGPRPGMAGSVLARWLLERMSASGPPAGSLDAAHLADLTTLLDGDRVDAEAAARRLGDARAPDGHVPASAPQVVEVLVAAVAERSLPPGNLVSALEVLARLLRPADEPPVSGPAQVRPREACRRAALRGYWALASVATGYRPEALEAAGEVLALLDEGHARRLLPVVDVESWLFAAAPPNKQWNPGAPLVARAGDDGRRTGARTRGRRRRVGPADVLLLLRECALLESRLMAAPPGGVLYTVDEELDPCVESDVRALARIHMITWLADDFGRIRRTGPWGRRRAVRDSWQHAWGVTGDSGRRWILSRAATQGPAYVAALRRYIGRDALGVAGTVGGDRLGWPRAVLGWSQLDLALGEAARGGGAATRVRDDLVVLLFGDGPGVDDAGARLEDQVAPGGGLAECAPAVVSVVVAAFAERSVAPPNLVRALGLLERLLGGGGATTEDAGPEVTLLAQCRHEAARGFWTLAHLATHAQGADDSRRAARQVLRCLGDEHAGYLVAGER